MANEQQLDLLKQGVATTWNAWREEHPDTAIELNGADLTGANLLGANLHEAQLEWAMLEGALVTSEQMSQARLGHDSL